MANVHTDNISVSTDCIQVITIASPENAV